MPHYECRRFHRFEVELPVSITVNNEAAYSAQIVDLSAVGMCVSGDHKVKKGDTVAIEIRSNEPGIPPIHAEANVIENNASGLRLDFSSMSQNDFEHLCEQFRALTLEDSEVDKEIAENLHLLHYLEQ